MGPRPTGPGVRGPLITNPCRCASTTSPPTPTATASRRINRRSSRRELARRLDQRELRRADANTYDRMIRRSEPTHHAIELVLGNGHASLRRCAKADVEEKPTPHALNDGISVVVDYDRVRVGTAQVVQVFGVTTR